MAVCDVAVSVYVALILNVDCPVLRPLRRRFFETFDAISEVDKECRMSVSQSLLRCKSDEERGQDQHYHIGCCVLAWLARL